MRQLPDVIALNEQFGGRDDFAIVTVSYDRTTTIDRMHEVIEEYGITFPVLHQFVDDKPWAFGYSVRYIPKSVLIDPMGNIWGDFRINDDFPEILEFLLAQDEGYLPVIFDAGLDLKGDLVAFRTEVYSPTHISGEVSVELTVSQGEDNEPLTLTDAFKIGDYSDFGYLWDSLSIPPLSNPQSVRYLIEMVMPGSEHLNGGKGLVISESGTLDFEAEE